jgi:HK97 family phage portal protein
VSIFNRGVELRTDSAFAEQWAARRSGGWAGVSVTPDEVLKVPAVFGCVQLTAGVISQLPFDEYVNATGRTVRQEINPPSPLISNPSADIAAEDWRFSAIESAQLHGNAVGVIARRDRRDNPVQVELIHPNRTETRIDPVTRALSWRIDGQPVERDDIWHMVGRPQIGSPLGMGLVEYMALVAGTSIAARRYGADWFASGGGPTVVLRPHNDPGDAGAKTLKEKVTEALRSRSPLVLPKSVDQEAWQGSKPSDADLVEMLRQNSTDVAMFFTVPPELVGGSTGDSMTYSNTEHRIIDLLAFGAAYWLNKLEKSLTRSLPPGHYVKANESAIIRSDVKTRTQTLVDQIRGGLMTQNEGRGLLDLPNYDEGDRLLWPPYSQVPPNDPAASNPRELADIVQKIYLGVGKVISADEARLILNVAGAGLPPGFAADDSEE